MNASEEIRLHYPLPIAKLSEAMRLETEPRQRVRKLVDLFERTVQYLALAGLATYTHAGHSDAQVEAARAGLERPSLGHWVALLKTLSQALRPTDPDFLTPQPARVYKDDALATATLALGEIVQIAPPKKVQQHHFLDRMVEFRNKKIGHGVLTLPEAKQIAPQLEAGLMQWLTELPALHERQLVYVAEVSWQGAHFIYHGTHLNTGVSLEPLQLTGDQPLTPERVYLHLPPTGTLIPLYPYLYYASDVYLVYLYNELTAQRALLLRCPYEAPGADTAYTLNAEPSFVLGSAPAPAVATTPAGVIPPTPVRTKDIMPMRNWFDIIPPHADIRKGHFDEAVFAADLGDVAAGTAAPDYRDPYLFFKKTYLTQGLRNLLERVNHKLVDGSGPAVVEIQTPFGGGKTHALVAIYHYLKHGAQVRELLPPGLELLTPAVSVIAGNHWDPVEGRTTEGLTRHTFWGEVAFQLAGPQGYAVFRSNDEARISPGKEKLRAFLEAQQPFMLLFDEILEYINRALDRRDDIGGSLGTQTFSFFQELTEAVATLPRGMLVVTLPSSYLEDFGERQEEALARLNKIFGRVESIETPVQGEEVYAVIRRRLFEVEHLKVAEMRQVVYQYAQAYQEHHGDLPAKSRDAGFREKMELAYPFHPDVIDILYEKWSTFSSFQRTRGVLRLLANVVEDLYQRETNIDLILPGDLNLERPAVRQEFLRHVGSEYEGIIGSDIAGHEAKAPALDAANKAWKHLAQRVATAIFFHSFSADTSTQGINLSYIKLAVLRSETLPALVTEILQRLANTLWYLNARGDAYFFSHIPNLNRMILDKKELFNVGYQPRLKQIIEKELGKDFAPYLWLEEVGGHSVSELIPDNRALKLVLLQPEDNGADIPQWIERKGAAFREYQNTLFFALADTAAFAGLREDVKTILALEEIAAEVKAGTSRLPAEKLEEVRQRLRDIERDLSFKVRRMYHTLRVGKQEIDLGQPVTGNETLSHWYWRELTSGERGLIVTQLHYRLLVNKFLATAAQVSSAVVLDQFYKNLDLPVPSETGVVARAIQLGVQDGALGLADVREGQVVRESLRFNSPLTLADVTFAPEEVLLARAQCEALLAQWSVEDAARQPPLVVTPPDEPAGDKETIVPPVKPPAPVPGKDKVFHRVHLVIADIPASKIADINRGVFIPLSNLVDGGLTFTLELDVSSAEGIPQDTLEHKIKETVRQIGARVVKEEAGE